MDQLTTDMDKFSGKTDDREIIITRLLDTPQKLVFKAWTDPKHLINWWGPNGFSNTFHEIDIRPGGIWRFTMHGPDGTDFPNLIRFINIVESECIEYLHGSGLENDKEQFKVTVTFEKKGSKTRLTIKSIFPSAAIRDMVIREYGAMEGGNQTVDRLEQELKHMK